MRRVAIIGCGGAGKTALALEVGRILDLPLVHIDSHHWRDSGAPSEAWPATHRELISGESWVIDGMKPGMLAQRLGRAETVVFLDLPRRTCLRGVVERRIRFRRDPRPELGRPDRLTIAYLAWVWRFARDVRPLILDALGSCSCEVVSLRSRREIDAYIGRLRATRALAVSHP
jgi:adenylate kinase family enzyme